MNAKIATHGSIISDTMRPEDLIPAFIEELDSLNHESKEFTQIKTRWEELEDEALDSYLESEDSDWDLESLFNMLDEHSPAWSYFGAHPGDGSDYGFWVSEFMADEFDGLKVDDTSEIPDSYVGEVLHVNDHGNMTLYVKSESGLEEVWALV